MSLLKGLQTRKKTLKHAKTRVRTMDGKLVEEEFQSTTGNTLTRTLSDESEVPFIVDLKPDLQVAQVTPFLYLGSQDAAGDLQVLHDSNITHILNVGFGIENRFPSDFVYFNAEILDLPEFDIRTSLKLTFDHIEEVRIASGRILVHCNAGVSRAPTIVIAYLLRSQNSSLSNAWAQVKDARPCIRPNDGFKSQLESYEKHIMSGT
eukprot:maker-scaffold911_size81771-snap-gene-0.20 protein:Tk03749 transcript:maker-scaffold911_size81771-snap-gene-0.20-mRNA-1 annotation:"dual specificity protein phosphatase 19"